MVSERVDFYDEVIRMLFPDTYQGQDLSPSLRERLSNITLAYAHEYGSASNEIYPFDRPQQASFWVDMVGHLLKDTDEALPLDVRREMVIKVFKRLTPHVMRRKSLWQGITGSLYDDSDETAQAHRIRLSLESPSCYRDLFIGTRTERAAKSLAKLNRFYDQWCESCLDPRMPM